MDNPFTEEATAPLVEAVEEEVTINIGEAAPVEEVVIEEAAPVEEEVPVVEEAPAPQVADYSAMEQRINDMQAELDSRNAAPQYREQVQEIMDEPIANAESFGDVFADPEAYAKNVQLYVADQAKKSEDSMMAKFMDSPQMQAMQNTVYTAAHDRAVAAAEDTFGDSFDYKNQSVDILNVQQKLPGLALDDAFRITDYNRLQEENRQMKEGTAQRQNIGTTPTNTATRVVAKKDGNSITMKVTAQDKEAANRFNGGDLKGYMEMKHKHSKRG